MERQKGKRQRIGDANKSGRPVFTTRVNSNSNSGEGSQSSEYSPRRTGGYSRDGQRPSYNNRSNSGERRDGDRFNNQGERREGDRPSYSRPNSNYGERREGDRPSYNRSSSSYGERRDGDRPSYNRSNSSYGERREGDRPSYNRSNSSYGERRDGDRPSYNRSSSSYGERREGGYQPRSSEGYNPNDKYSKKKQILYKQQHVDYDAPMRLNKYIANAGICSRREADEFIQAGVVTVNGQYVTELGTKVIPSKDRVLFHDQEVKGERRVYILLNKPKDCVTTLDDPQQRKTVIDIVRNSCSERIYPVGRLDRNTTGVILITNDGDLTSKLAHPKNNIKKIYDIVLDNELKQADLEKLRNGITLEDGDIKVDDIQYTKDDDNRYVGVEIHSGRNRIVRRMFDFLGYKVVRLDRVYFAGLTKKKLPRGKFRHLTEAEINMLKMVK